jgi:hypothetical protein
MTQAGPQLRDIHLPADPSWWPPAPGWWILFATVLGLLVWLAVHLQRRASRRRWQRSVLNELERIATSRTAREDSSRLLAELSQLLRRASRLVDASAPALRGEAWLQFLDSSFEGEEFSSGSGRVLLEGPYRRRTDVDADALIDLVRRWLRHTVERQVGHV